MDDDQTQADAMAAVHFRADDLARRTVEYHRVREAEHRSRERFGRRFTPFPWSEAAAAVLSDEALEDEATVVALIRELGRQGCSEVALAALDMVVARGSPPASKAMFDAAILVCATEYQDQRCLDQYDRMRSMGLSPDLATANLVLTGLCCRGRLGRAVELLGEMRAQLGLRPNSYSVLMVLQACNYKRRGAYREAIDAVQALEAGGRTANEEVIEALLQVCEAAMRQAPTFEAAVAVFTALAELHLADSTRVYNGLLGAAGRAGRWREAQALYAQMQEDDVPASLETHTALIQACVVGRALDHALDIFEHLVAGRSAHEAVPASITTYNHLIHACHQAGMLEKALEIAAWVQKTGVEFDDETYGELMATIDVAQLWDDKAMKQARQRHRPVLPRHLRPAPYDPMRVMYLDHLEALQQEELLAMEKLGGQGSWAPKSLTRGSVAPGTAASGTRSTTTPPPATSSATSSFRSLARAVPSVAAISVIGAYEPATAAAAAAGILQQPHPAATWASAREPVAAAAGPPSGPAPLRASSTSPVGPSSLPGADRSGGSSSRSPSPQQRQQKARAASVKQLIKSLSTRPLPVLGPGAATAAAAGIGPAGAAGAANGLAFRGPNATLAAPPPGPTGFHEPPTWAQVQTMDAATAGPGGTPFYAATAAAAAANGAVLWVGPDGAPATITATGPGEAGPPGPATLLNLNLNLAVEPANLYGQASAASLHVTPSPRRPSNKGFTAGAYGVSGGGGMSLSGVAGGGVSGGSSSGGANLRIMVPAAALANGSLPPLSEPISPAVPGGAATAPGGYLSLSPRTLAPGAGPVGAASIVRQRTSRSTIGGLRGSVGASAGGAPPVSPDAGTGPGPSTGIGIPAAPGAGDYSANPLPAIASVSQALAAAANSSSNSSSTGSSSRRYPTVPSRPGTAPKPVPAAAVAGAAF